MEKRIPQRIVLYTRDIENISGKSTQAARRLMRRLRKRLGKLEGEFITIPEFCELMGLHESQVLPYIRD